MFRGFDRSIWVRFWGVTLLNTGNNMIRPFLSLYLAESLHASFGLIGLIMTLRPLGSFFGNMLGGYYADKIGRKPVMLLGIAFDALSLVGYGLTHSILWFAILSLVQGLSSSFAEPANNAMIADVTKPEDRARAYSLMFTAVNVGAAIGPLLAGGIILQHPNVLFVTMAALTFLFCIAVFLLIPETKPEQVACTTEECRKSRNHMGYGFVFRDWNLGLYLLGALAITLGYNQMNTYLPLHLNTILPQSATWLYGVMWSVNGTLCAALSMPMAQWADRYNPYKMMQAGGAVYTVGILILALNQSVVWMLIGFTIFTIGEILFSSVNRKVLADFAPADMRARYMSAGSLSWTVAATIGPLFGGLLMQHFGGHWMFIAFTAIMGLSVAFFRSLQMRRLREALQAKDPQDQHLATA